MLSSLITAEEIVIDFSKVQSFETGYSSNSARRQRNMHEESVLFKSRSYLQVKLFPWGEQPEFPHGFPMQILFQYLWYFYLCWNR